MPLQEAAFDPAALKGELHLQIIPWHIRPKEDRRRAKGPQAVVTCIVIQVEINHAGIEVQPELEVRQIVQIGGGKGTPGAGVCNRGPGQMA